MKLQLNNALTIQHSTIYRQANQIQIRIYNIKTTIRQKKNLEQDINRNTDTLIIQ
jgi:hypothetical protein